MYFRFVVLFLFFWSSRILGFSRQRGFGYWDTFACRTSKQLSQHKIIVERKGTEQDLCLQKPQCCPQGETNVVVVVLFFTFVNVPLVSQRQAGGLRSLNWQLPLNNISTYKLIMRMALWNHSGSVWILIKSNRFFFSFFFNENYCCYSRWTASFM